MQFLRRTTQRLHEEHQATLALLEDLEGLIARGRRHPPDLGDSTTRATLKTVGAAIQNEVRDHFTFEEDELFTRLAEAGESEIGDHLLEEHGAILPIGERVRSMAEAALVSKFDEPGWIEFSSQAAELIERLRAHVEKEEMALLPLVDEILDAEADLGLCENYGATA